MRTRWLVCVLLGTIAWSQAAPGAPPQTQAPASGPIGVRPQGEPRPPQAPPDTSASVPDSAAVLTIEGVCPPQPKPAATTGAAAKPTAKKPAADCKTVITKAQFEKLANALSPNVTPQLRRQLAGVLPRFIAMSDAAKKQGLDKTPAFAEALRFARMQILTNELQRKIQADAAKVPDSEIESYYQKNPEAYEQFNLERLFVPRNKQMEVTPKEDDDKDKNLTDEQKEEQKKAKEAAEKSKAEAGEQEMTKLADTLRQRAAAGEDFATLQKEAFEAAGMKISSPTVSLTKVRRTGLPQAHAAVFDLKAGDVSQVINDSGGHYIYKVVSKDQLTLDQVKEEIHTTLQNQRLRDMMEKVNGSFKVESNEAYFGPATPTPGPRGPMGNPHMAPGVGARPGPAQQTAPAATPQAPSAPQTPSQPSNAKPD
jgi:bifunctional DNA-binding transcriptional regulator/antitoxin component of YhaV-PrlF toxin-antitoxin module